LTLLGLKIKIIVKIRPKKLDEFYGVSKKIAQSPDSGPTFSVFDPKRKRDGTDGDGHNTKSLSSLYKMKILTKKNYTFLDIFEAS
jgi:hypothetical protein